MTHHELLEFWRNRAKGLRPINPAAAEAYETAVSELEQWIREIEREDSTNRSRASREHRQSVGNQEDAYCRVCRWRSPLAVPGATKVQSLAGLSTHHVVPRHCGGTDHPDNLILICDTCHSVAHILWPVVDHRYLGPVTPSLFVHEMEWAIRDFRDWQQAQMLKVMQHREHPDPPEEPGE